MFSLPGVLVRGRRPPRVRRMGDVPSRHELGECRHIALPRPVVARRRYPWCCAMLLTRWTWLLLGCQRSRFIRSQAGGTPRCELQSSGTISLRPVEWLGLEASSSHCLPHQCMPVSSCKYTCTPTQMGYLSQLGVCVCTSRPPSCNTLASHRAAISIRRPRVLRVARSLGWPLESSRPLRTLM